MPIVFATVHRAAGLSSVLRDGGEVHRPGGSIRSPGAAGDAPGALRLVGVPGVPR